MSESSSYFKAPSTEFILDFYEPANNCTTGEATLERLNKAYRQRLIGLYISTELGNMNAINSIINHILVNEDLLVEQNRSSEINTAREALVSITAVSRIVPWLAKMAAGGFSKSADPGQIVIDASHIEPGIHNHVFDDYPYVYGLSVDQALLLRHFTISVGSAGFASFANPILKDI